MGRRGQNLFKRNDVMRAVNSARDAGIAVAGVEVVCKDGTVIRVFGESAAHAAVRGESNHPPWPPNGESTEAA